MQKNKKILEILKKFDGKGKNNPDWKLIKANLYTSLIKKRPIQLISFTCSTINPAYMFDKVNPENYVSLDPTGNNLEICLPKISEMAKRFGEENINYEILILIGNTDPFYIYTQEGKSLNFTKKQLFAKYNSRWVIYKKELEEWIKFSYPELNFKVVSWYELEKDWERKVKVSFYKLFRETYKNIDKYYSQVELEWEFVKLENAFGEGRYFGSLEVPPREVLQDWIKRKFSEYTIQGLWIKQIFPYGILMQNEMPTDLRYKMYQPLIKKFYGNDVTLPNIYPFGVDNFGFN